MLRTLVHEFKYSLIIRPSSVLFNHQSVNLATLAITAPTMGPAFDVLSAPQSLNNPRPGAPNLFNYELPPPNYQTTAKYPSPPQPHATSNANLITSPDTNSTGSHATSSLQPVTTTTALPSSYPSYWPNQGPFTAPQGSVPSQPWPSEVNALFPQRTPFAPSSGQFENGHGTAEGGVPQSPYDINHLRRIQPAFTVPSSTMDLSQQQQQQQQQAMAMMGTQSVQQPKSTTKPLESTTDPYGTAKSQPPLPYGSPSPLTGAHNRNDYTVPYGSRPNGPGIQVPTERVIAGPSPNLPPGPVPNPNEQPSTGQPTIPTYQRPTPSPWPSYSLPAMPGPIMTNMHNPNGSMSLVGNLQPGFLSGVHSGHAARMQQIYTAQTPLTAGNTPQSGATINDRPFKCDQCPQSFNRNHDLKRHKRIHLAVKPFPCSHCEKSFSRKDALKVCYHFLSFHFRYLFIT